MSPVDTDHAVPSSIFSAELRAPTVAILLVVALSAFEGLAVVAALPQVAADLGAVSLLPWVVTSYLLTSGVATVAAGALVDRLGVARCFRWSVALFVLGAVLAGLAPTMPLLLAARVIQGAGAGACNAVALASVGLVFPKPLIGRAFAANSTVWGVMGVAGPAIAAGLLTVGSWRWIFLVNVPLGAAALVAGWRPLPAAPPDRDGPGTRLSALSLALLATFTLALLLAVDALSPVSLLWAALALGTGWWVLRRGRGRDDALVRPRHVLDAPFGPLGWTIALLLTGALGTQTFVPLYVAGARGVGAGLAAWSVLFFTVGWTIGANVSSRLMDRLPALRVTTLGAWVVGPGCLAVGAGAGLGAPLWVLFALLAVAGTGMGSCTNSALTLLQGLADDAELGRATAAHQYVRNQGFALGAALGGAVLLLVVAQQTGDVEAVRGLLGEGGGEAAADVAGTVGRAIGDGYATAGLVGGAVALTAHLPLRAVRRRLAPRD